MEVSPAKSLILSATIHGGSYFFIQPNFVKHQFWLPVLIFRQYDEYFEWKINWLQTCDDCGKYEPQKHWKKS